MTGETYTKAIQSPSKSEREFIETNNLDMNAVPHVRITIRRNDGSKPVFYMSEYGKTHCDALTNLVKYIFRNVDYVIGDGELKTAITRNRVKPPSCRDLKPKMF